MSREPIFYKIDGKPNVGELGFMEQEGYIPPDKYTVSPRTVIDKKFDTARITRILNSSQNACIMSIERSAGTELRKVHGTIARAATQACFNDEWSFYYIIPNYAYRLCNINAEPGTPVEIKFYFYDAYKPLDQGPKEKKKQFNFDVENILEALKYFYGYDNIEVQPEVIYNITNQRPAFIQIKNENLVKHVKGYFYEAPVPIAKEAL